MSTPRILLALAVVLAVGVVVALPELMSGGDEGRVAPILLDDEGRERDDGQSKEDRPKKARHGTEKGPEGAPSSEPPPSPPPPAPPPEPAPAPPAPEPPAPAAPPPSDDEPSDDDAGDDDGDD